MSFDSGRPAAAPTSSLDALLGSAGKSASADGDDAEDGGLFGGVDEPPKAAGGDDLDDDLRSAPTAATGTRFGLFGSSDDDPMADRARAGELGFVEKVASTVRRTLPWLLCADSRKRAPPTVCQRRGGRFTVRDGRWDWLGRG